MSSSRPRTRRKVAAVIQIHIALAPVNAERVECPGGHGDGFPSLHREI